LKKRFNILLCWSEFTVCCKNIGPMICCTLAPISTLSNANAQWISSLYTRFTYWHDHSGKTVDSLVMNNSCAFITQSYTFWSNQLQKRILDT
jgi:hypothetical protein